MASPNTSWSEITTTTLLNRSKTLANNVEKNNALLSRLSEKENVKTVDGGEAIVQELEYAENSTYKRYTGYDVLNIATSDVFSAAQYSWAQAAVAVSISGLELLKNSGSEKVLDLLEQRIKNAERTMRNNLSNDCYSNGSADGSKQIGGLQLLVADTPTSGTVGGINRANFGFWQNQAFSFAGNSLSPSVATIQTAMNRLWLALCRGSDKPDLIIADNTYFRLYWESLQAIQRVTSTKTGEAGFESLKFMTADVVFDGGFQGGTGLLSAPTSSTTWTSGTGAPSSHLYMLNTDFIFFRPHTDRYMVPLEADRFSVNQDAMVKLIAFAGNMTMSNAFLQGCIVA